MTAYDTALLALSPLAAWSMEGGSTSETDISGNGNTGTWNSAPSSVAGLAAGLGSASDLSAGTKYCEVSNAFMASSRSALTVIAWTNFTTSATYKEINTCATTAESQFSWLLRAKDVNYVEWIVNVSGTLQSVSTSPFAQAGTHMLAGTYDGTTLRLYIDGTQIQSAGFSGSIPSIGTGKVVLGGRPGHTETFIGTADSQAVFGTTLTQPQLASLYAAAASSTAAAPKPVLVSRAALVRASTR